MIHGYSDSYFKDNDIKKQLTSGKKIELLRCFNPVVIVNIQGIHQKIDWPDQKKPLDFSSTMVYVIFQKKPIN